MTESLLYSLPSSQKTGLSSGPAVTQLNLFFKIFKLIKILTQRITQKQTTFGIGIVNLNRFAISRRDDIARFRRAPRGHVLRQWRQCDDAPGEF